MHLYFITRGRRRFVKWFIDTLEDIFIPYTYKGEKHMVQCVPREVKIWEMVFPESARDDILAVMNAKNEDYPEFKWTHKLKNTLAKMLGLKKIPKNYKSKNEPIPRPNVAVHLLGIKPDSVNKDGERL